MKTLDDTIHNLAVNMWHQFMNGDNTLRAETFWPAMIYEVSETWLYREVRQKLSQLKDVYYTTSAVPVYV